MAKKKSKSSPAKSKKNSDASQELEPSQSEKGLIIFSHLVQNICRCAQVWPPASPMDILSTAVNQIGVLKSGSELRGCFSPPTSRFNVKPPDPPDPLKSKPFIFRRNLTFSATNFML
ncbi:hypothetical protein Bca4012_037327 [Brassica carinata]|uniref:Uncharacterized protein n=1 Tax=Brassica carinata TaxID=52824 RepID=A0A8X7WCQ9_BRACI|nr:hypothetical protein Bca52824_011017 [Brassica carinata]